ncbi:MAG: hypothetical protein FWC61_01025 [Proteobacteria bacterium]|nr:hypothetical protein [Pseudomonadota bacterium]
MPDWLYILTEIMMFIGSAGSIVLLNMNNRFSKYGVFLGLIGQPFWFIHSYYSGSVSVFATTIVFTISYAAGVYNFWVRTKRARNIRRTR